MDGHRAAVQKICLLYVDDEPPLLLLTKKFLEKTGQFSVDTTGSAPAALGMMEGTPYDAIVSDYEMPGMNGIELLREVRKRFGALPFILFTGRGREEVVIQAMNEGADFYLQKGGDPLVQFAELGHKVRQAVKSYRADQDLKEREAFIKTVLDNLPIGIAVNSVNPAVHFEYINDNFLKIYRISRDTLAEPDAFWNSVYEDPDFRKEIRDRVLEDCASRDPERMRWDDIPVTRASGETTYISAMNIPIRNSDLMLSTVWDVTARRQAEEILRKQNAELNAAYEQLAVSEEELKQNYNKLAASHRKLSRSEERFRQLFEAMSEGLALHAIVLDRDGQPVDYRILAVNSAFERILGIERSGVVGKLTREAYGTDEPPYLETYSRVLRTGSPETFETFFPPLGKYFSISVYSPRKNQFATVFEDITGRRRAEEELRESEKRFNLAIEGTGAGLWDWDIIQDRVYFSPRWKAMLGYEDHEVENTYTGWSSLWHPDDRDQIIAAQEEYLSGRSGRYEIIHRLRHKDGSWRWVLTRGGALRDPGGRPYRWIGTNIDITDRKQDEEALKRANRQLALLTGITRHDILNSLMALRAYLDISREYLDNPGELSSIFRIEERILDTIERQIAFTREYEEMGVKAPAWHDVRVLAETAGQGIISGINFENELAAGTEIYADPMILTVFRNLVDNAVRHGERIRGIRFSETLRKGGLVITCEDDGIGIAAEEKEHIFERGIGGNTGLGLFLVREILAITGISITETGDGGKGARFEMVIPDGGYRVHQNSGKDLEWKWK